METLPAALFPITFVAFLVLERLVPGRAQPRVPRWLAKGLVFFALSGVITTLVPALVSAAVAGHAPLALDHLPVAAGALACFVVTDLVHYARHRLLHAWTPLWRLHQMHHSAERVDVAGTTYLHPLDLAITAATTACVAALLGVSPLAAAISGYLGFATSLFLHLDARTPRWLAYVIHRPETHAVHHARGVHAHNYGTLALWDRLFGTYAERIAPDRLLAPQTPPAATPSGFWDGASREIGAMLLGRDVTAPRRAGSR